MSELKNFNKDLIEVSEEVEIALLEKKPIVCLESTIISHGMPYPDNVKTALEIEDLIRSQGVVPATIGIISGKLKIGLNHDEIEKLGSLGSKVIKVSRRDFGYVLGNQLDGATTVAGTMIGANLVGIKIFATGGIGGVHRGAQNTFDISADLDELGKTPVLVVCAGAKSILDLKLTLEYLETKGVPFYGYQTKELPAFYNSKSGLELEYEIQSPDQMAKIFHTSVNLGLKSGAVLGVPIPTEFEMDQNIINDAISQALSEAQKLKIEGKETTPFLLAKIKELTQGDSLESNIALVRNNATIASQIALAYAKLP